MFEPNKYQSMQQMLEALAFHFGPTEQAYFHGSTDGTETKITIPVNETIGHSPSSFYEKMKRRKWVTAS